MRLTNACLKKPLVVFIITLALFFIGVFSLRYIPMDLVPLPTSQSVNIEVDYAGASPSIIENQITKKLVTAIQSLPHIDSIDAKSLSGVSKVSIQLAPINKLESIKVFTAISQAVSTTSLPSQAEKPILTQGDSESSLISFILYSDTGTPLQLYNYYQSHLKLKIKKIQGVSRVDLTSDITNPVVRIKLNPEKMQQYNLNVLAVKNTLEAQNQNYPLGNLALDQHSYMISINAKTSSLPAIEDMVVGMSGDAKNANGHIVHLKDIADVSYENQDIVAKDKVLFGKHNALSVTLVAEGQADPINVSKSVTSMLHNEQKTLPPGMHLKVYQNSGELVQSSIDEVLWTIALTALLVAIICFAFLGRCSSTFIPIITIPICLAGTLLFLALFGFSINLFTLLAMVIAIGIVVDDAIVMVEHITVNLEKGMPLYKAVSEGAKDIALTIIGITLTLCVVYIPTLFMSGFFAIWYQQFTVTLAMCVLISGVLALTLSPVMCRYLLTDHKLNRYQQVFNKTFDSIVACYQRLLTFILKRKKTALLVIASFIACGLLAAMQLPKDIMAKDPNTFVNFQINADVNDTPKLLADKIQRALSPFLAHDKRINLRYTSTSTDKESGKLTGKYQLSLYPRYLKQAPHIAELANQYLQKHTHLDGSASVGRFFQFGSDSDISIAVLGDTSSEALTKAQRLLSLLKKNPMFLSVDLDSAPVKPQYSVQVDSERALQAGLSEADIRNSLQLLLNGNKLSNKMSIAGQSVPIVVQVDNHYRQSLDGLQYLTIKNKENKTLRLKDYIHISFHPEPMVLQSLNGYASTQININLAKGYSMSNALEVINQTVAQKAPGTMYQYVGSVKEYFQNNKNAIIAFVLGIVGVYLILALLFNSLMDPFIILFTVPFSLIGGALSLYLVGGTINIVTTIALITLVGLITKHGVLVVQFANQERSRGLSRWQAILNASANRFRPIMMTTLAMMMGSLPLVFAQGQGYLMREQLGLVLFSGLIVGTLFSLFIVPLVYLLLTPRSK